MLASGAGTCVIAAAALPTTGGGPTAVGLSRLAGLVESLGEGSLQALLPRPLGCATWAACADSWKKRGWHCPRACRAAAALQQQVCR